MLGEFDLIRRYFAPLARGRRGTFDLTDDAAVLTTARGSSVVVTADAMVAGIHFLPDDPPHLVARKLLRVNLSDLAAMGARPLGYVLTAAYPPDVAEEWIEDFAAGLAADQDEFDVALLGGDTTRTSGPTALSITALGEVREGEALLRSTARAGDLIYVSGTIGDGALGLKALKGELKGLPASADAALAERYRLPRPRVALGQALARARLVTAAIDVSDGLVGDLGHIAETSRLAARVRVADVPMSAAAAGALEAEPSLLATVLTGGDDYELAFTIALERASDVDELADRLDLPLTCVGWLEPGEGVSVLDRTGRPMPLATTGWTHF